MTDAELKKHAAKIVRILNKTYPEARCSLDHKDPLQLLVSTILSAQCTDERVNIVTQSLFKKYKKAKDYASAPIEELEADIKSTGFYRNKAKNIQGCCRTLAEKFGGKVPPDLDELVQMPGIGRKTANVVLGTAFQLPTGVVVDTHVSRLARRMGLTTSENPEKVEADLMRLIPKKEWIDISHRLIQHGRRICKARKPDCENCPVTDICPKVGV